MESQAEYESRELRRALAEIDAREHAPLRERQEARQEWAEALKDPALVGERVGWLLEGCYGHGQYLLAWQIVRSPRMNRVAALGQLVAVCEWMCPRAWAASAWAGLTKGEQEAVNLAVLGAMDKAIREKGEGQ